MSTLPRPAAATLVIATLLLAGMFSGCSGEDPASSAPDADRTGTTASTDDADTTDTTDTDTETGAVWAPEKDICAIQDTWRKISPKIDAKEYEDAMLLTQSVFPPDSIKDDWAKYRALLEGYVATLESGDQAAITNAYPDTIRITEVRIRYNTAFLELC